MEGIFINIDYWIRIYYIVFFVIDVGVDYKLLKVEGGVYGFLLGFMEFNINF